MEKFFTEFAILHALPADVPLAGRQRDQRWLDHLAPGQPCHLATPPEARQNLEVTLAIEETTRSRETVRLNNFS